MNKAKKYQDNLARSIHETAKKLYKNGEISLVTMREFDESCLTKVRKISAKEIKAIRRLSRVSQDVFAKYLNVTKTSVSQWERGEKSPGGAALKLLSLIKQNGIDYIA